MLFLSLQCSYVIITFKVIELKYIYRKKLSYIRNDANNSWLSTNFKKTVKFELQIMTKYNMEYQSVATSSIKSAISLSSNPSMYEMSDRT